MSKSSKNFGSLENEIDWPLGEGCPRFSFARAMAAILIPMPIGAMAAFAGTHLLGDYGWALFVGLPFVLPMVSVLGYGRRVTIAQSFGIGALWILTATLAMLATAFEGLICLIILMPLAVPIVMLGAFFGYVIVASVRRRQDLGKITMALLVLIPGMLGAEHLAGPDPLHFTCTTSVVIDAPPEEVWRHVVSFSDLAPPNDWLFWTGVAYPIRARIEGAGVGAVRHCEFSTGPFVEPIEVWDEPRLLRFSVTSNPAPMREWNPFFEIHPPHLDGFFISRRGQFLLTRLEGGKTLLEGSTLYQHGLGPAGYWRLWSDPIIHRIHNRVLEHIKTLSEAS